MHTDNVNEQKKKLESVNFKYLAGMVDSIDNYLFAHGIITQKIVQNLTKNEDSNNVNWLKQFELQPAKQAFYLEISQPNDVEKWNYIIAEKLDALHDNIENFLGNNSAMDEAMKQKISRFKSIITKAKKALDARKRKLNKGIEACATVGDMQELVADMFGKLIKEKVMELIMQPLYEGMKSTNDPAYQWMLKEVNGFLTELGIITLVVNAGETLDYNLPFMPNADSKDNITDDYELQDVIKEVECYAYVFNENKEEKRIVCEGRVSVWRFTS